MLQDLVKENRSNQKTFKQANDDNDSNRSASLTKDSIEQRTSNTQSSITSAEEALSPTCFDQLLSWRSCRASRRDGSSLPIPLEAPSLSSTLIAVPLRPVDAYTSELHTDTWTRTGWTTAHLRHLFDALITWDYLPFCLLCKDSFLQDFESGSTQFCSSTLVYTMLALATRLVNEDNDDTETLPTGWFGSTIFFEKAQAAVQDSRLCNSLPDIQALGLLSLYKLRCGQEAEAQGFADDFAASITDLCQREPLTAKGEQYARVRATTYCGAISLIR